MRKHLKTLIVAGFFLSSSVGFAYQIIEVNLPTIVSKASVAFRGTCETKEVKMIYPKIAPKGIWVTHYVFSVKESLKGDVGGRFEFDQYGTSREDAKKRGVPHEVGFVDYTPRREYVVFLTEQTNLGVRTTMGLQQGVFDVNYGPDGRAVVVNKFSNKSLFKNLPKGSSVSKVAKAANVDAKNPGPIAYEDFKKIVDSLK